MAAYNWTPRQISEDITVPQMVALWLRDEADGRRKVSLDEAAELLAARQAEKRK